MEIKLPEALERFVQEQLDTGRYSDASEVVGEALRWRQSVNEFEAWQRFQQLKQDVQDGWEQAERGEFVDDFSFDDLIAELEAEEAAK